jgi:hypothetical protein
LRPSGPDRKSGPTDRGPLLLAGSIALVYLIWQPASADLAAATYRAGLFSREGFTLFNTEWYAGHHTLGYSVLFPPLASLLGVRVLGALSVVAGAALFAALFEERLRPRRRARARRAARAAPAGGARARRGGGAR